MLVVGGLSSRRGGVIAFQCFVMFFLVAWWETFLVRYFGVDVLGGGRASECVKICVCWNLWVHVRTNPGRAGVSLSRPPGGVPVPLGM